MMAIRLRPDVIFLSPTPTNRNSTPATGADRAHGGGHTIHTIEFWRRSAAGRRELPRQAGRQSGGEHAYVDCTKLKSRRRSNRSLKDSEGQTPSNAAQAVVATNRLGAALVGLARGDRCGAAIAVVQGTDFPGDSAVAMSELHLSS